MIELLTGGEDFDGAVLLLILLYHVKITGLQESHISACAGKNFQANTSFNEKRWNNQAGFLPFAVIFVRYSFNSFFQKIYLCLKWRLGCHMLLMIYIIVTFEQSYVDSRICDLKQE